MNKNIPNKNKSRSEFDIKNSEIKLIEDSDLS